MKQQSSDFQERPNKFPTTTVVPKTKSTFTAEPVVGQGPSKAAAAEQELKGTELEAERKLKAEELLAERNLTKEELLALHQKTKAQLVAAQAKNKDLLEAVRYRDRKIAKLGPGVAGGGGRIVGSNVTDHSHLGEALVEKEVPAQTKPATKQVVKSTAPVKKPATPKN